MKTDIKVKGNKFKQTFTIREYRLGKVVGKYRTVTYDLYKFEDMEYYTEEMWREFILKNKDEYIFI